VSLKPPVSPADHAAGDEDAPVTLVEYGDYECPHCGRAYPIVHHVRETLGPMLRFVFRNFPLSEIHPHAVQAAEMAEAAAAQGKFWEMHELLFTNQHRLDDAHLLLYAAQIGMDVERARREIEAGIHLERVQEDFRSGVRSGVNGTPTFFINGLRYDGSWDLDHLLFAIQRTAALSGRAGMGDMP
jgi:protein-disulfide isomerase